MIRYVQSVGCWWYRLVAYLAQYSSIFSDSHDDVVHIAFEQRSIVLDVACWSSLAGWADEAGGKACVRQAADAGPCHWTLRAHDMRQLASHMYSARNASCHLFPDEPELKMQSRVSTPRFEQRIATCNTSSC
jgi:hypothetical protein